MAGLRWAQGKAQLGSLGLLCARWLETGGWLAKDVLFRVSSWEFERWGGKREDGWSS